MRGETKSSLTPLVSVRDVVASHALVGQRIQVQGRCLSVASEHPLWPIGEATDEWQLEDDGVAIYVLGPAPLACAAGIEDTVALCAFVMEDTLPPIGDLPPAPRRYVRTIPVPSSEC